MDALLLRLNEVPLAGLMLVVMVGFLLGRIRFRGISVGPAGGTLVFAIVLGHLGLSVRGLYGGGALPPLTVGLFGFSLFIYSVGFEAGPRFFSSLRGGGGWRFVAVGTAANVMAVVAALAVGWSFDLDASTVAGLLAGALTSAPTYAAAAELAPNPAHLSVAFAMVYPVGLLGLVLLIQVLPRALRRQQQVDGGQPDVAGPKPEHGAPEVTRTFEVERDGSVGVPLRDLDLTHTTGCVITRVRHDGEVHAARATTTLALGDRLLATGRIDELREFEEQVGRETYDPELASTPTPHRVQVTRSEVVGKTLADLDLIGRFDVVVVGIESADVLIEPSAEATLHHSDVVLLVGEGPGLYAAAHLLGRFEPSGTHTDIAIYAGGILLGALVGTTHLEPLGFDFSLGLATGLLLSGVVLGRLRQIGPFSAQVPRAARQLVRDLGILLFVAESGLEAGAHLAGVGTDIVWRSVAGGGFVVALSLVVSLFIGRRLLRLPPFEALGSVCGGMTSSAALVVLRRAAGPAEPAVSYAAAYAVASVLVTLAGQLVVRWAG